MSSLNQDEALSLLASATDLLNSWAREMAVKEAYDESDIKGVIDRLWNELSSEMSRSEQKHALLATSRAETAAMLEKAAALAETIARDNYQPDYLSDPIRALITADQAAALEILRHQSYEAGANWMLDLIRISLQGYPDHGGDIGVMQEVDRIVADHEADIHHGYQSGAEYEELVSAQVDLLTEKYRQELAGLRKQISDEGMVRFSCGHFQSNLIGDDYGHFKCDACRLVREATLRQIRALEAKL